MQILGLLGMYFDASEVFVINFSLLFRLALGHTVLHMFKYFARPFFTLHFHYP